MGLIAIDHLAHSYPDGRASLSEVSLVVAAGESVGLIGPNGAGKTTLFLLMCGILKPKSGTIRIAGLDPQSAADRKKLPAKVGMIFQNSDDQLFSATVGEDVAFGPLNLNLPRADVQERVETSLRTVGLTGFEERVPFQLSGGEKRRAAIAGILAMRPEIWLLDEPSMFLDSRGRSELIQLLKQIPGTKLIASHDLRLIEKTCTRIVVLDEGRIIADGPTSQILGDVNWLESHGLEPF